MTPHDGLSTTYRDCIARVQVMGRYSHSLCKAGFHAPDTTVKLDESLIVAEISEPRGLACTERGDLLICDSGNGRIQYVRFDDGVIKGTFRVSSMWLKCVCHDLQEPTGVVCWPQKLTKEQVKLGIYHAFHLVITESFNHRINYLSVTETFVYDHELKDKKIGSDCRAEVVCSWGGLGSEPGQLRNPRGIAMCSLPVPGGKANQTAPVIIVCDSGNHRLQVSRVACMYGWVGDGWIC